MRSKHFTQRVVGVWNELPEEVVKADTIRWGMLIGVGKLGRRAV